MFKLLFVLVNIGAAISATTPVKPCPGIKDDLFKSVVVTTSKGVCTSLPCQFESGKNVTADITFAVKHEVSEITMKCNATALGITIQYPIPNEDKGCDQLKNTYCPIEPSTDAELEMNMLVDRIFPKVYVDLVFYLVDQNNEMISCFKMGAKVVGEKSFLSKVLSV